MNTIELKASLRQGALARYSSLYTNVNSESERFVKAIDAFSEKYGARNLRRLITRRIEDPAANLLISDPEGRICGIFADVQNDEPVLTGTHVSDKLH